MNYEIVTLKEKILVGISTITSNLDPKMNEKISRLWRDLYEGGINSKIKHKANEYAIGLYSDYTPDGYVITVGNEVLKSENSELITKIIPSGNYAKFSVHGHMQKAVCKAWEEISKMDLNRAPTGDFEEYLNSDWENAHINIYIALK